MIWIEFGIHNKTFTLISCVTKQYTAWDRERAKREPCTTRMCLWDVKCFTQCKIVRCFPVAHAGHATRCKRFYPSHSLVSETRMRGRESWWITWLERVVFGRNYRGGFCQWWSSANDCCQNRWWLENPTTVESVLSGRSYCFFLFILFFFNPFFYWPPTRLTTHIAAKIILNL